MDVEAVRRQFPILSQEVNGHPLVYLDSAATSQKPLAVIEAVDRYYREYNANVHRGIHTLSERATEAMEEARAKVARFIHAPAPEQLVFVNNATEAINLVAYSYGSRLAEGDEILLTPMEHHSNLVPWQLAARRTGARLRFIPLLPDGTLDLSQMDRLLGPRTRLVAVTHVSNVLGTINPVGDIAAAAHRQGVPVLVDGAQSVPHMPVDVQALDCDFLAFSGHKMLGPMGIGVLYGKRELLERMDPFLAGGEMISEAELECSTWQELPYKFEGGTPHVVGAIGLGAAVDFLEGLGMDEVFRHEQDLVRHALKVLREVDGVQIYGPEPPRGGVIAFNLGELHPHDLSTVLDQEGIAIRVGHHCAQPLTRWLDVPATARASFYVYTTRDEIDVLARALEHAKEFFGHVVER
ncbi:cysteine desulfurase [Limnochorda pilosa]|uniref:Cysteine desulfurase n=1 Tax=Limnochorda pilosa TaxID=1555112 RepID=A0A0K2SJR8_LIMPI|nr:cysteine desulfurase [Limnochorda pilosa]BAS27252.1 cysteine desulfurase [Limnochorda pilosa]